VDNITNNNHIFFIKINDNILFISFRPAHAKNTPGKNKSFMERTSISPKNLPRLRNHR